MAKTKLYELANVGQSVLLDYMHRSLIHSSGLRACVDQGLRGVTSNPAIFEKTIAESEVYDEQIHALAFEGKSTHEICDELVSSVLLGIGTALVYPTLLAAISDVAHPDWRASAVRQPSQRLDC